MRALITGATGFVGRHLAEALALEGAHLSGIAREGSPPVALPCRLFLGSILDSTFLNEAIAEIAPTHVFHLAGQVQDDDDQPTRLFDVNVGGTALLLNAIERAGLQPVVVITGSSAVYGRPQSLPLREDAPFLPLTNYSVSKAGQEMVGLARCLSRGMHVVRTRVFNLIGPGQPSSLVASSIARQIAIAEAAGGGRVVIGRTDTMRDYVDVRDAVRAHLMLAAHGAPGEVYNVCSGRSRSVQELLDMMVGGSAVALTVESRSDQGSLIDIKEQAGSFERLNRQTGWTPEITIEQSVGDLLKHWRTCMKENVRI